jgi:ABC-type nitrate/sulfonate/bicarbonate transport system permease component
VAARAGGAGGEEAGARPLPGAAGAWRYRIASLAALAAAWEVGGRVWGSNLTVPPFSRVAAALAVQVASMELWAALGTTLLSLAIGFGAAILAGIPLGLVIGWYRPAARLAEVYLRLLLSMPVSPMVPVLVVIFGINRTAQAAVVFLFSIVVLILNTAAGVRGVNPRLVEMARSFGASDLLIFRRVVLPAAAPAVMAGLRLGTGRAVIGMVVAELVLLSTGIGRLVTRYSDSFQAAPLFAVILVVLAVGVGLITCWQVLERRLLRWQA